MIGLNVRTVFLREAATAGTSARTTSGGSGSQIKRAGLQKEFSEVSNLVFKYLWSRRFGMALGYALFHGKY